MNDEVIAASGSDNSGHELDESQTNRTLRFASGQAVRREAGSPRTVRFALHSFQLVINVSESSKV